MGESPSELLRAHLFDSPLPFSRTDPDSKVPPEVREALVKALQKRREDRFGSAEEFDREVVLLQQRFAVSDDLDDTDQIISKLRVIAPSARVGADRDAERPGPAGPAVRRGIHASPLARHAVSLLRRRGKPGPPA